MACARNVRSGFSINWKCRLEDVEADATEDELAAERAAPLTVVKSFERRRPARKPFPEHLPRERVVIAAPQSCPCCGSTKLSEARRGCHGDARGRPSSSGR